MSTTVTGPDGRPYVARRAGLEPVFVAEQRHQRRAWDAEHTGLGLLVGWLDPVRPGDEPLAQVRLPDGRVLPFAAAAVCPATGIARRRIAPKLPQIRRFG